MEPDRPPIFKAHLGISGEPAGLINRGFQFAGLVRAAQNRDIRALGLQRIEQAAPAFLTGADHHRIHLEQLWLAGLQNVKALIVNFLVAHIVHHFDAAPSQREAVGPTGRFAQTLTHLGVFPLQQIDIVIGDLRAGDNTGDASAWMVCKIDAPFFLIDIQIQRERDTFGAEEFADIKADATGANHNDLFADSPAPRTTSP